MTQSADQQLPELRTPVYIRPFMASAMRLPSLIDQRTAFGISVELPKGLVRVAKIDWAQEWG